MSNKDKVIKFFKKIDKIEEININGYISNNIKMKNCIIDEHKSIFIKVDNLSIDNLDELLSSKVGLNISFLNKKDAVFVENCIFYKLNNEFVFIIENFNNPHKCKSIYYKR